MTVAALTEAGPKAAPARSDVGVYLGFGAMVLGQFMAFLDIQIVASSLQQIQSGVGATADEISWVQTAYIIPEVVMIPLAAYLSRLWGTRVTFVLSCAGFTAASVLVGMSTSIEMMIVARALQGFAGGAMIPTVFAAAFTVFPPERRIAASTVIAMIVTLAPTLGPSLGGVITDNLDWRWLFYVNVIPGAVVMAGVWRWGDFDRGDPALAKGFDWWGLLTMALFLMSMQYVFEEGPGERWFDSETIVYLTVLAACAGAAFAWRTATYHNPIIDFRIFRNRNFIVGATFTFVMGVNLFGVSFLLPLFLGRVGGLSAGEIGLTMGVSGLAMFIAGPVCARLVRVLDLRVMIVGGMTLASVGLWDAHALTPEWGFHEFAAVQALRSFGTMLAMVASQQLTMATLPAPMVKNASGLLNLSRNVGGALGLALLSSVIGEGARARMIDMSARIAAADPQSQSMLQGLTERMEAMGVADPAGAAYKAFAAMIERQALTVVFGDAFAVLAAITVCAGLFALLSQPPRPGAASAEAV
ncbi:MAG: DHA2 family efflux MFS transporter permease subunit [Hyphomonadaceae bacterium]|nr:DHA2 family efflux MFS transporter permease subunit [Hyphomonadaceae bacterium]